MTLTPISIPFPDAGEGFNRPAAEAVVKMLMGMGSDDEALMFATLLVGESIQRDQIVHQSEIAKALAGQLEEHLSRVAATAARAAVAKGLAGQDVSAELAAVEQLAKAFDSAAFSPEERARRAREQHRDLHSGRFVVQHERITHTQPGPIPDTLAAKLGIPAPRGRLTDEQRRVFQSGYHQVSAILRPYSRLPKGEGVLHLVYGDGSEELQELPVGGEKLAVGTEDRPGLDPTRALTAVKVSVIPSPDAPGAAFSTFNAAGLPRIGAVASGAHTGGALDPDTIRDFEPEWNRRGETDQFHPSHRLFRRLGAGSALLDQTLGDAAPNRLKMALQVGQHVGSYGPEAQKVIGPAADRAAYRYRGTPLKEPAPAVLTAVDSIRRDPRFRSAGDKREALIHGIETDTGWAPSPLLSYFRGRLPRTDLNLLQRRSGTIPPSEGIIFDRTGRVVTQSVGYGDDHYLPFDFTKLARLRGGEYLRTRTWGGPTTEDLYTGLMSGARAVTVASHNGVFSLEFDPTFKGGRRYSDKAARMVARYGQLLDAVKNGQIAGQLDPGRLEELAQQAGREYDPDTEPERYEAELAKLRAREHRRPQLSRQQRGQAAVDFFDDLAARQGTGDGHPMTAAELTRQWAMRSTAGDYARYNTDYTAMVRQRDEFQRANPDVEPMGLPARQSAEQFATRALQRVSDPNPAVAAQKLADAMGVRREFDAAIRRAEEQNKAALKPLQLDGDGYEAALNALQEQFPYYIHRVEYHRWSDGQPGGWDTGYVKPQHNRPAAALAGYFDRALGGKVRADSIRFQNGRLTPVAVRGGEAERPLEVDRPTGPSQSRVVSGETDPEVAAVLAQQADREMVAELKRHVTFSPQVQGAPAERAIASQPVADYLSALLAKPALHHVLSSDDFDLESELQADPAAFHRRVAQAVRESEEHHLFDLDPVTVRSHRNEGRPDPVRHLGDKAALALNDPAGTEYAFPDRVFHQDSRSSPAEVETAYINDPRIAGLVDAGELPAHPGDGEQFGQDSRALREKLRGLFVARARWAAQPGYRGPEPVREPDLHRQAEGLIRAEQLRRRYVEAQQRATTVVPGAGGYGADEVHWHLPGSFDPRQFGLNSDGGTLRDANGISYTGD